MIFPSDNQSVYYSTNKGICINDSCESIIHNYLLKNYKNKIQMIFTSPPFPLKRAKKYGNKNGDEYKEWLCNIIKDLLPLLTDDGSLVIEMGNAWNSKEPTFSTLPLETLLDIKNKCNLNICEEFIYFNPARLPSPIEWVNKQRIRVKDSFTRIWWFSKSKFPYANNKNVLENYSKQMQKLISTGKYNSGKRPSEHNISQSAFSKDNGGAIPSNVIIAANTSSHNNYITYCKKNNLEIHPARMAPEIPEFFIKFLTKENDIVLDCFAGSNTTGFMAESLNRSWISIEINKEYYEGSRARFGGDCI